MGLKSWWKRTVGGGDDGPDVAPAPGPPTEQDILAALNRVNAMLREGNAPPVVVSRVVRIARTIHQTLPRIRNLGLGSQGELQRRRHRHRLPPRGRRWLPPAAPRVGGHAPGGGRQDLADAAHRAARAARGDDGQDLRRRQPRRRPGADRARAVPRHQVRPPAGWPRPVPGGS
ncbi:hypothetical protein [Nocardioides sp. TF02-7]|uniref:hypothetical protein n=1 Tax=Nocardioides sp. TF02-7 TaxID=2917724 RepID=UPI001F070E55|nr:hypothetical protein [Nocardioides sp. TF02-7]UMG93110.1 hypothetical protein MF408_01915 [Nocardioides sp. TF02-7]